MHAVIPLSKPAGKTPLWCLQRLRELRPELAREKMSYAGRLDPLAAGVLIALVGEACLQRDTYLNLTKTYQFSVVPGIETDTFDVLGIITKSKERVDPNVNSIVNSYVNKYTGTINLPYPPYSSKTVHGKPLFWWAREGKLSQITLPHRDVTITSFALLAQEQISLPEFKTEVERQIASVSGDFRQKEILEKWHEFFAQRSPETKFTKLTFTVTCSSGTYVRTLAHILGEELGTGAITLAILRTRVGDFTLEQSQELF